MGKRERKGSGKRNSNCVLRLCAFSSALRRVASAKHLTRLEDPTFTVKALTCGLSRRLGGQSSVRVFEFPSMKPTSLRWVL